MIKAPPTPQSTYQFVESHDSMMSNTNQSAAGRCWPVGCIEGLGNLVAIEPAITHDSGTISKKPMAKDTFALNKGCAPC
jgi:hypothetical protein